MRKFILTFYLLLCVVSISAFPIVTVGSNGSRQMLDFDDVDKILFDDSNGEVKMTVVLLNDKSTLVNVSKILFRETISTNLDEPNQPGEIAEETIVESADSVIVSPGTNTADFTWPKFDTAVAYSLTISKDGVVLCSLQFNSNGQLVGIDFSSSNRSKSVLRSLTVGVEGLHFKVTGLNSNSHYTYSLSAQDEDKQIVASFEGEFNTLKFEIIDDENEENDEESAIADDVVIPTIKVENGKIESDQHFEIYNILGMKVTSQNGYLLKGVYLVVFENKVYKILVR